jgi:AcrR family transcriptional regulator
MGRPRHQPRTADDLLDAAERLVEAEGVGALSVRRVAEAAGTTTRAVYSLFGSKDGLVTALGARAYDLLRIGIEELRTTDDPAADLVEAGIVVFREFAVSHPSLFRVSVQRTLDGPGYAPVDRSVAEEAWVGLEAKIARLELGGRSVRGAATSFHALCEGLAALELRGMLPAGREEAAWRDALGTLVRGFAAVPSEEPASLPGTRV